jgi:hypothetical protein
MDLIFVWLDGSQTVHAYSIIGLTIAVYAVDFTDFVQSLRFRRINPSVLFPLPPITERPYNSRRLGKKWQRSFNAKKCIVIRKALKNKQARQTSYKLHGHTLENVEASKYLTFYICNSFLAHLAKGNVSFCHHLASVIHRLSSVNFSHFNLLL